jgi:hypothetical protein
MWISFQIFKIFPDENRPYFELFRSNMEFNSENFVVLELLKYAFVKNKFFTTTPGGIPGNVFSDYADKISFVEFLSVFYRHGVDFSILPDWLRVQLDPCAGLALTSLYVSNLPENSHLHEQQVHGRGHFNMQLLTLEVLPRTLDYDYIIDILTTHNGSSSMWV